MVEKKLKTVDIEKIKDPFFLKELSYEELDKLSEDIREFILEKTSTFGGHLSSNLGTVDAIIALCRVFDFTKDKIIFDVGHQCYTYKILTGRPLNNLRRKGGISGFQRLDESKFDHYSAGHSSTSISAALGLAYARDLNKENYNIIAFIGDASFVNGLSFEAINNLNQGHHKIIIVLNDNGMGISSSHGGLAALLKKFSNTYFLEKSKNNIKNIIKKFIINREVLNNLSKFKNAVKRKIFNINFFEYFGLKMIGPIDGHNIKKLEQTFELAKKINSSSIIYIKTKKGKGYSYAENDTEGLWHGVSSFNIDKGETKNNIGETWSKVYADILYENMKKNEKIISIVPGTLVGSELQKIYSDFPLRSIDVGIAEEHAFVFASALSLNTFHPVITIYSTFMQRGYDEISHDLARLSPSSTLLIDRSGLVGNDGETHQGIFDEQFLLGIPNVTLAMASRKEEGEFLFSLSLEKKGVFAIRFPRENIKNRDDFKPFKYGEWLKETSGSSLALVSLGPVVLSLKDYIKNNHKDIALYNALFQFPMDEEAIKELLAYPKVIIYNPYAIKEGFASLLCSKLKLLNYKGEVIIKAIEKSFIKHMSIEEQRKMLNVSIDDIIKLIS